MEKIEYALFRKACECLGMTVSACLRQTSKETIIKAFGADIYDQLQLRLAAQKRYKPYEYQEQQKKMATYFGVSLFYLRGESNDPTTQESWMTGSVPDEPVVEPVRPRRAPAPQPPVKEGSMLDPILKSAGFRQAVHDAVLDVLRSKEGQQLLEQAVARYLRK